jgi:sugar/nucleoside kinase (ribokinase family)
MAAQRNGILAAGNFIVDYVKMIDCYPGQDMLATIFSKSQSNGGGPYNVLKDLAAMQVGYPLAACGVVGDDENGRWIASDCTAHGIDISQLHVSRDSATSYTDAMTVQGTGRRTFFHHRGANALFDAGHADFGGTTARILHLGYLMLLDRLDSFDERGRSRAGVLLEMAQAAGLETSVDMVSLEHPQFRQIALAATPFTDHLIVNELEAARVLGTTLAASDAAQLVDAARRLLDSGVRRTVTVHTEHGAVSLSRSGEVYAQASLSLPSGYSKGATGAGDAFAAGLLHGLHDGQALAECLRLAVCTAAASLSDPTPSRGVLPVRQCLALGDAFGFGKFGIASG